MDGSTIDPATIATYPATLDTHEAASQARYSNLMSQVTALKEQAMTTTTTTPGDTNVFASNPLAGMMPFMGGGGWGGGNAAGAGAGGLGLGAILGLALGQGGLFGNNNRNGDFVTSAGLQAALNGQTQGQDTVQILQNLATIQQLIPENEGKVQLALAQAQIALQNQGAQGQLQTAASTSLLQNSIADARHNINDNVHTNGLNNANQFAAVQRSISDSTAATNSIVRATKDVAEAGFAATQLGIAGLGLQAANNTSTILSAIRDGTDRVTAQNAAINDATLNRLLVEQSNEIIELKGDRRQFQASREVELNISQNVNQNNLQQQQQSQQQQVVLALSQICGMLGNLTQVAQATNSNVIAGNTGATTTGAQTSTPTNVNTR